MGSVRRVFHILERGGTKVSNDKTRDEKKNVKRIALLYNASHIIFTWGMLTICFSCGATGTGLLKHCLPGATERVELDWTPKREDEGEGAQTAIESFLEL